MQINGFFWIVYIVLTEKVFITRKRKKKEINKKLCYQWTTEVYMRILDEDSEVLIFELSWIIKNRESSFLIWRRCLLVAVKYQFNRTIIMRKIFKFLTNFSF